VSEYPWYSEVSSDSPLTQGDIIEACPVVVFRSTLDLSGVTDLEGLLTALQPSVGLEQVRVIVMTQACDLEHQKVRSVILCPVYHLSEYRAYWEEAERRDNQNPTPKAWSKHTAQIKDGMVWNLTMLAQRDGNEQAGDEISIPPLIVDFHEIFSLPIDFLATWVTISRSRRLRLRPPYREHLSQAFARFFMRVGLPLEIDLTS
jgi:hypothetical protein